MVHDHDSIYSDGVDLALTTMGLRVLKTPLAAPQANAFCERLIGTARRACSDFMIPLNERHLRRVLADCVTRYNQAPARQPWSRHSGQAREYCGSNGQPCDRPRPSCHLAADSRRSPSRISTRTHRGVNMSHRNHGRRFCGGQAFLEGSPRRVRGSHRSGPWPYAGRVVRRTSSTAPPTVKW
jgi:hypothetical protein